MSTKIYCAYRFPLERAEKGIQAFHKLLLEGALEHYSNALDNLDMTVFNRNATPKSRLQPRTEEFKSVEGKIVALSDMLVLGDRFTREAWDNMSCGFNAWISDGYMYVVPWANYRADNYFDKVEKKLPKWIEEFGYWDNVEPPDWVVDDKTEALWEERGKLWEKAGPGSHKPGPEPGCLIHEVVDCTKYTGTGELVKLYRKRNKLKSPW